MTDVGTSATLVSKIEATDPLYLHASDSSTLSLISMKLKGTENYTVWSNALKLALRVKNKIGFIDGTFEKPTDNEVLANQWERCNSVVLTWILNSVSEELYVGQVYSKLASEVWTDLRETYDKIDGSVIFNLYQKINSVSQNGSPVSEYYHRLTTMWKQFDNMLQLPSCSCNASDKFNDFNTLIKLMQFLMGLDEVYQPVRTSLLIREPLPTLKTAFSIISREESHRLNNSSTKGTSVGFLSKANQPFDNRRRFNRGPNPNLKCTNCNKIGHTVDRCFEIVGYPPGFKPSCGSSSSLPKKTGNFSTPTPLTGNATNSGSNSTLSSLTPEQMSRLLNLLGNSSAESSQSNNVGGFVYKESPDDW
ncbi:hypothetical protein SSX86_022493 [Deinandra increscens subsp. villosa]|uniref:Retrotransposon Copia-like N-terminal domain-containing protein n=1 Tax=Deinandra increscens subsp. villosa TaxID=3103831 RepID=A0AAP0GR75_9ASTR